MKSFLKKYLLVIIGVFTGGIAGYVYYHFYGCTNGCAITSKPINSVLYGSFIGGLLFSSFKSNSNKNHK